MLDHEEAAKAQHPTAKEFSPVVTSRFAGRKLIGWIFSVDEPGTAFGRFSWVTDGNEVSADLLRSRSDAFRNLRAYVKGRSSSGPNVTASGHGSVAAGGDIGGVSTGNVTPRDVLGKEN